MLFKPLVVISTLSVLVFGQGQEATCRTSRAGLGYKCMKNPGNGPHYKAMEETRFCCGVLNGVFIKDTWTCYSMEEPYNYGPCCRSLSDKAGRGYVQMGDKDMNIGITRCSNGTVTFGPGCKFKMVECGHRDKCALPYDCPG